MVCKECTFFIVHLRYAVSNINKLSRGFDTNKPLHITDLSHVTLNLTPECLGAFIILHTAAKGLCTHCSTWAAQYNIKLTPKGVVVSFLLFLFYTEQLLLFAGGCTWQWLQKTTQLQSSDHDHELDSDTHPAKTSMHADSSHQKPSHVRGAAISSRHAKQTKRLLRLFRHALTKQSSAAQPASEVTRSDSAAQSSHAASLSATSAPPVPVLASADPAAAVESLTSAGLTRLASVVAPVQSSAALYSESEAHPQTVFLVETSIPWEVANLSACQVPCVFDFSVLPSAVPGQQLQSSGAAALGSLEDQKLAAEEMVAQALKQVFQGCNLHCSSSIKVVLLQPFMQNLMQKSCLKREVVQIKTV